MPSSHGEQADQTAKQGRLTVVLADEDRAAKGLAPAEEFLGLFRNKMDFAFHSHWLEPEVQPHLTSSGTKVHTCF